jgi:hemerythrin-like metal-binding protein
MRDACAAALAASEALALGAVREGLLVYASPALARILGLASLESPRRFSEFIAEVDRERVARALASAVEPGIGVRAVRADGSLFEAQLSASRAQLSDGPAIAVALQDVSRTESDPRQLSYAALYDSGSGLPNRRLYVDRVQQAIIGAARSGRKVVAMALEVADRGPRSGAAAAALADGALREIGSALQSCLRETDTVARLGEDLLGVLLPRVGSRDEAAGPAARMAAAFADAGGSKARAAGVVLRFGIAAYPDDAPAPDLLLEQAMAALGNAAPGHGSIAFAPSASVREPPALVRWSTRYEVGVDVIDGQHRQLLELINRLGDDLAAGRDFDQLVESLKELVRYTEHHFATEERLMDEIGAGAERHRAEHRRLIDGLMRYTVSLDAEGVSRSSRFLQDWLFHHIDEVDRPFAAFLRARGVT